MASFEPHRSCTGPATATLLPKLNLSLSLSHTHTQVTASVRIKITSSSKALHCAVNYCSVETQLFFPLSPRAVRSSKADADHQKGIALYTRALNKQLISIATSSAFPFNASARA
jgi:hypothetical protein